MVAGTQAKASASTQIRVVKSKLNRLGLILKTQKLTLCNLIRQDEDMVKYMNNSILYLKSVNKGIKRTPARRRSIQNNILATSLLNLPRRSSVPLDGASVEDRPKKQHIRRNSSLIQLKKQEKVNYFKLGKNEVNEQRSRSNHAINVRVTTPGNASNSAIYNNDSVQLSRARTDLRSRNGKTRKNSQNRVHGVLNGSTGDRRGSHELRTHHSAPFIQNLESVQNYSIDDENLSLAIRELGKSPEKRSSKLRAFGVGTQSFILTNAGRSLKVLHERKSEEDMQSNNALNSNNDRSKDLKPDNPDKGPKKPIFGEKRVTRFFRTTDENGQTKQLKETTQVQKVALKERGQAIRNDEGNTNDMINHPDEFVIWSRSVDRGANPLVEGGDGGGGDERAELVAKARNDRIRQKIREFDIHPKKRDDEVSGVGKDGMDIPGKQLHTFKASDTRNKTSKAKEKNFEKLRKKFLGDILAGDKGAQRTRPKGGSFRRHHLTKKVPKKSQDPERKVKSRIRGKKLVNTLGQAFEPRGQRQKDILKQPGVRGPKKNTRNRKKSKKSQKSRPRSKESQNPNTEQSKLVESIVLSPEAIEKAQIISQQLGVPGGEIIESEVISRVEGSNVEEMVIRRNSRGKDFISKDFAKLGPGYGHHLLKNAKKAKMTKKRHSEAQPGKKGKKKLYFAREDFGSFGEEEGKELKKGFGKSVRKDRK